MYSTSQIPNAILRQWWAEIMTKSTILRVQLSSHPQRGPNDFVFESLNMTCKLATQMPKHLHARVVLVIFRIAVAKVDEEINQAVASRKLTKRRNLRSEQKRAHECLINYVFGMNGVKGSLKPKGLSCRRLWLLPVCRGWRDVAWSVPSLWSTIRIMVGASNWTSDRINFVCDWILRSQSLPLHIILYDKGRLRWGI